jgi:hypothetical protein
MMETADFGKLDDLAHTGRLDGPRIRRVLAEREMSSRFVIVGKVSGQNPTEMLPTEDNHVIETLAAYGFHKAFSIGILPGQVRCGEHLVGADALDATSELLAIVPPASPRRWHWRWVLA